MPKSEPPGLGFCEALARLQRGGGVVASLGRKKMEGKCPLDPRGHGDNVVSIYMYVS